MRKLVLILLMAQMGTLPVFAGGLLTEVCRVPELIEHFYEHQSQQPGLSFISFLNQHYLDVNSHSDDHEHSLPFKSTDEHVVMVFSLTQKCEFESNEPLQVATVYPMALNTALILRYSGSIFQPPKL